MSQPSATKKLLQIFETLNKERQNTLLEFAEFLHARGDLVEQSISEPVPIERPESETVVGAIKRLKLTYPMIDSMKVFSAASALMTDHMVKGRDTGEVIEEMQKLFDDAYRELVQTKQ